MKKVFRLIVYIFILTSAVAVKAQDYLFFSDSDIPTYYDPSYLNFSSPSELLTVNNVKFPVVSDTFYSGINALKLSYKSVAGGDWVAAVAAPGWPGRDATLKDSIVFMVYSAVSIDAVNLPMIFVEDLSNQRSTKISLGYYNPSGVPAGVWTKLWIPLDTLEQNPGTCDLTRVKTIFFGQSVPDNITRTFFIDNVKMTGGESVFDFNYIVVLGSSTSAGTGANPPDSSYVNRVRKHLTGVDSTYRVLNLAVGGYTTYHVMPTGFIPPQGRPTPRITNNISYALEYIPKAIFINLPSNDAASNYPVIEQIANFDTLVAVANRNNIKLWITTTQPRNFSNQSQLDMLIAIKDSVFSRYSQYAVDFWTSLAQPNGHIVATYNSGDGIHLNNAGHRLLYERAINSIIPHIVPVELISFNAFRSSNEVFLQWATATEVNNLGFEVQRSTDGINFTAIDFIEGAGTTTSEKNYQYTDGTVNNYFDYTYRLKQIDLDGQISFSGVVFVEAEIPSEFRLFQNYPNPFNPVTKIAFTIPQNSNVELILFDINGKEVAKIFRGELKKGYHIMNFDGSNLASGVYTCRLVAGNFLSSIKIVLLK